MLQWWILFSRKKIVNCLKIINLFLFYKKTRYSGVPYPDWGYAVGWTLVGLSAVQIPLWAILMTIYYACKGKLKDVVRPTSSWGPGDKEVRNR